ncbi:MAG: transposase [Acidobacteria bacterium]|nr:transposase [Acidobacteriota bacterium]
MEISRATLDGWVMQVGEALLAVRGGMRQDLLAGSYIQADETTVAVQTGERSGKNLEGYLWQFGRPGGEVVFEFATGRAGARWRATFWGVGRASYKRMPTSAMPMQASRAWCITGVGRTAGAIIWTR